MQIRFPKERPAWDNFVQHLLQGLRVDYARLWQVTPQIPDPEVGMPFMGPLNPAPFQVFPQESSGSASAVGTLDTTPPFFSGAAASGTSQGCLNSIIVGISDVANINCLECGDLNGTYTVPFIQRINDDCYYLADIPGACGFGRVIAVYSIPTGFWAVAFEDAGITRRATYGGSCTSPFTTCTLTLSSVFDPTLACSWPATITIQSP